MKPEICYICSAPRSGSTFTDLLLGGHPAMASLGEVSFLGKNLKLGELCSCGSPVGECEHWGQVFDYLKKSNGIDLRVNHYGLPQWDYNAVRVIDHNQQTKAHVLRQKIRKTWLKLKYASSFSGLIPLPPTLERGIDNTFDLYQAIRASWGCDVVIDSSKNVYKALSLYQKSPATVRIVLLTRDGRGVYLSRRSSGRSRKTSIAGWKGYYQEAFPHLKKHLREDHLFTLRYEDLAAQPEVQLRKLCSFLEQPYEASMLALESGERHAVNGNANTKKRRNQGIRLDERWRTELTGDEMAYFIKFGFKLNQKLGYV